MVLRRLPPEPRRSRKRSSIWSGCSVTGSVFPRCVDCNTSAATRPLTLVFFGYTHCPDVCQVVMANIASAMTRLDPSQRSRVGMVFVTTDPVRDDVHTLHRERTRHPQRVFTAHRNDVINLKPLEVGAQLFHVAFAL